MHRMLDKLHLVGSDFSDEGPHPLRRLNAGSVGDPAIAILDAWATVADVLSFYQERIANEGFLRTATERRSILELAGLIGYELAPGAAAETYLAFTVEDSPGSPDVVNVPASIKVQSIPDPGKYPQIFESSQEFQARSEWNSLRPRITKPQAIGDDESTQMLLKGIYTRLKHGDLILLVGSAREADPLSDAWQVRRLIGVSESTERDVTLVKWEEPIKGLKDPSVFALRSHASLFGSGAADWTLIPFEIRDAYVKATSGPGGRISDYEWPGFQIKQIEGSWAIDLDSVYDDVCKDSWVILTAPPPFGDEYRGMTGLFRVKETAVTFRSEFAFAAKISRIFPDTPNSLENFPLRQTEVFFNSEPLFLAEVPLAEVPLAEAPLTIDLSHKVRGLTPGRVLAFSGIALPKVENGKPAIELWLKGGDAPDPAALREETASEAAIIRATEDVDNCTRLTLEAPLKHRYDPASLKICANVVRATHGETISETLGSGDKTLASQSFVLKKPPLTYIRAATSEGVASTLEVRVNGVSWREAPSLYGLDESSLNYILRIGDEGKPTIIFGDGKSGARLPTGEGNVKATYRSGIGPDGNLPQGRLVLLQSRPPGIRDVTNPVRASGGELPETLSLARNKAPATVQTLGRVVSLRDYESFSLGFPGVGKAFAASVRLGGRHIVHITIAASDGLAVDEGSQVIGKLTEAIDAIRNPIEGVLVKGVILKTFSVVARVQVGSDYLFSEVEKNIIAALRARFSFDMRQFGESVCESEVIGEIQRAKGVEAVVLDVFDFDVESLCVSGECRSILHSSLTRVENGVVLPAQLLLINTSERGVVLKDMNAR